MFRRIIVVGLTLFSFVLSSVSSEVNAAVASKRHNTQQPVKSSLSKKPATKKPAAKKLASKPIAKKTTAKPAPKKPAAKKTSTKKSVAKKVVSKPITKKAGVKPTPKKTVSKVAVKKASTKPVVKSVKPQPVKAAKPTSKPVANKTGVRLAKKTSVSPVKTATPKAISPIKPTPNKNVQKLGRLEQKKNKIQEASKKPKSSSSNVADQKRKATIEAKRKEVQKAQRKAEAEQKAKAAETQKKAALEAQRKAEAEQKAKVEAARKQAIEIEKKSKELYTAWTTLLTSTDKEGNVAQWLSASVSSDAIKDAFKEVATNNLEDLKKSEDRNISMMVAFYLYAKGNFEQSQNAKEFLRGLGFSLKDGMSLSDEIRIFTQYETAIEQLPSYKNLDDAKQEAMLTLFVTFTRESNLEENIALAAQYFDYAETYFNGLTDQQKNDLRYSDVEHVRGVLSLILSDQTLPNRLDFSKFQKEKYLGYGGYKISFIANTSLDIALGDQYYDYAETYFNRLTAQQKDDLGYNEIEDVMSALHMILTSKMLSDPLDFSKFQEKEYLKLGYNILYFINKSRLGKHIDLAMQYFGYAETYFNGLTAQQKNDLGYDSIIQVMVTLSTILSDKTLPDRLDFSKFQAKEYLKLGYDRIKFVRTSGINGSLALGEQYYDYAETYFNGLTAQQKADLEYNDVGDVREALSVVLLRDLLQIPDRTNPAKAESYAKAHLDLGKNYINSEVNPKNLEETITLQKESVQMWSNYNQALVAEDNKIMTQWHQSIASLPEDITSGASTISLIGDTMSVKDVMDQLLADKQEPFNYHHIFLTPFLGAESPVDSDAVKFARVVSQVIRDLKVEHIAKHFPTDVHLDALKAEVVLGQENKYNFDEIAQNGLPLLIQRLNLGFGLGQKSMPITEDMVKKASYSEKDDDGKDIYDPVEVVHRFFKGDNITWTQKSNAQQHQETLYYNGFYTRDLNYMLTRKLNNEVGNSDNPYDPNFKAIVDALIKKDYKLEKDLEKAELQKNTPRFYGTDYFEADQDGNLKPHGRVIHRLLVKTGFIIDEYEND